MRGGHIADSYFHPSIAGAYAIALAAILGIGAMAGAAVLVGKTGDRLSSCPPESVAVQTTMKNADDAPKVGNAELESLHKENEMLRQTVKALQAHSDEARREASKSAQKNGAAPNAIAPQETLIYGMARQVKDYRHGATQLGPPHAAARQGDPPARAAPARRMTITRPHGHDDGKKHAHHAK